MVTDDESMEYHDQRLFQSRSCHGVSFEMKDGIDRLLIDHIFSSTAEVIRSDENKFISSEPAYSHVTVPDAHNFGSRRSCGSRYTISFSRHGPVDCSFGQTPADQDELDQDDTQKQARKIILKSERSDASANPAVAAWQPRHDPKSRVHTNFLEQSWFSVYKRLFVASFIINFLLLVLAISTGRYNHAKSLAAIIAIGNILVAVLVRNEVFLFVVFWLTVKLFGHSWIPTLVKNTITASLQSLGGVHSGCAISSVMWLIYAIQDTIRHDQTSTMPIEIAGVAIVITVLLVLSCLVAFPLVRHLHHDLFERIHRLSGWSSLALVWVFILLSTSYDSSAKAYIVRGSRLASRQQLWYTAIITFMIILPWSTTRRIPVETIIPPAKTNSLLNFSGGIKPGILKRISLSPLSDWHTFGIISDGNNRHTILAGAVGDFTKGLVEHPPSCKWVRSLHSIGLPYLVNMYERVLLVATGSGICVFMSFLLQPTRANVHVIWIAKSIHKSYGDEIFQVVRDTPACMLTVFDTAISGRPTDTAEVVVSKSREWRAQVVIVTSNPRGTKEIVGSCRKAGVPAFGPIWDS